MEEPKSSFKMVLGVLMAIALTVLVFNQTLKRNDNELRSAGVLVFLPASQVEIHQILEEEKPGYTMIVLTVKSVSVEGRFKSVEVTEVFMGQENLVMFAGLYPDAPPEYYDENSTVQYDFKDPSQVKLTIWVHSSSKFLKIYTTNMLGQKKEGLIDLQRLKTERKKTNL